MIIVTEAISAITYHDRSIVSPVRGEEIDVDAFPIAAA